MKKVFGLLLGLVLGGCGGRDTFEDTTPKIDTSTEALTSQPGTIGAASVGGSRTFLVRNVTTTDGSGHTTTTSRVWAAGVRNFGVLGDGCTTTCGSAPTPLVIFSSNCSGSAPCIVDVKSGSAHTLILDSQGRVFHFGGSFNGEACKVDHSPNVSDVLPTQIGTGVDRIAAGGNGSWFHGVAGGWFYCGVNTFGQGGIASNTTSPLLGVAIDFAPSGGDWAAIAGGSQHTLFRDGQFVYAMGANGSCEVGNGNPAVLSGILCGFDAGSTVWISAGAASSMCAGTAAGSPSVWTWGDNSNLELGDGTTAPNRCAPGRAYVVPTLEAASESAYGHTAIISYHNSGGAEHIACAGDNHNGQCAVSAVSFPNVPNFTFGDTILSDGLATPQRSFADSGGDVIRVDAAHVRDIGNNTFGQLGIGNQVTPQLSWQATAGF